MNHFNPLKSQSEIDAEEDRRAQWDNVRECFECAIAVACLAALLFVPMMFGGV